MSEVYQIRSPNQNEPDMVCERVKRLTQGGSQPARQALPGHFFRFRYFLKETKQVQQMIPRFFLDMVRPGWDVFDRVAALIKQGLQLNPENGRILLILHYAGDGVIGDNGLVFAADSQCPRAFNYDRTINPKLE
ncbi:hypothetical protein MMC31_005498, partial [Peltigera leucophlebia]|nr:hypothetical protein [Peltigera leucophlebia]